jgi:hypothetical protein
MREGLTGNLQHWPLTQALSMLCASRQTGVLELNDGPDRAEIGLLDGAIVDISEGPLSGEEALTSVALWTHGTFVFDNSAMPSAHTISRSSDELLAEITALASEMASIRAVIPSLDVVPVLSHALPGDAVILTPPEWQVVSYSDGRTDLADLCSELGRDSLSVSRVVLRLAEAGLLEIRHEPAATPAPLPAVRPVAMPVSRPEAAVSGAPQPAATKDVAGPAFMRKLEEALRAAMGPIATVAIDDQLANLGTTSAALPRESASMLVERLATEITDPRRRVTFTQAMLPELRNLAVRRAEAA